MRDPGRILLLGAGPAGLGAAHRLHELGHTDWLLLEARESPGGLAASYVDPQGFTWDCGGHVQFSHYAYYDAVLDRALGERWLHHRRRAGVWLGGRLVPYPLQHNLHRLPAADRERALAGLERAHKVPGDCQDPRRGARKVPGDFHEWVLATFGEGLAELFFEPYNEKVWGYPLRELDWSWVGERVALPDLDRLRSQIAAGEDDAHWGPNRTFRFPERGGTGAIWSAVAGCLPSERLRFRAPAERIDPAARTLRLTSGEELAWDTLISTVPLDRLVEIAEGLPAELHVRARSLRHSAVHVVGVGLRGPRPEVLDGVGWLYFPGAASPYYRVTVFSNYSPHHVPAGDGHWSLMAEVCESPHRPVAAGRLGAEVVAALRADGLLPEATGVVSLWQHREEHGYPTPFLGRDGVVDPLLAGLARLGIHSRGRFGAWKYEVSNQDHAFMQGVELAERLLGVGEEVTLHDPGHVNAGAYLSDPVRLGPAAAARSSARANP